MFRLKWLHRFKKKTVCLDHSFIIYLFIEDQWGFALASMFQTYRKTMILSSETKTLEKYKCYRNCSLWEKKPGFQTGPNHWTVTKPNPEPDPFLIFERTETLKPNIFSKCLEARKKQLLQWFGLKIVKLIHC